MKGIDVSKHNGSVNWAQVDASGIDFALIRAGYGNDISQKDPKFESNVSGALAHKLAAGIYWFSYAISAVDARKEAQVCKQVLAPYKGKLAFPVAFDYEYASMKYSKEHGVNPTNALTDSIARAFLDSLKDDGWFVNLYTNLDFIRSGRFSAATLKAYDVWLADYSGGPDYVCGIQQTGDQGKIPGISGNVDLDVAFKDYSSIIRAGGYNGYPKPLGTMVNIDTTMDLSRKVGQTYTVKTVSSLPVSLTAGTGGIVKISPFARTGNIQLFALTAVGKSGSGTGIYTSVSGEKALKRFVFNVA